MNALKEKTILAVKPPKETRRLDDDDLNQIIEAITEGFRLAFETAERGEDFG
jgi:hypothetical protein